MSLDRISSSNIDLRSVLARSKVKSRLITTRIERTIGIETGTNVAILGVKSGCRFRLVSFLNAKSERSQIPFTHRQRLEVGYESREQFIMI